MRKHLNSIILLFFSFLLKEILIFPTLVLNTIGILLMTFSLRPSLYVRNTASIILLISYWVTFKKVFDPEVGLNFLTSVTVLKILERENSRDDYMIFFGMILLISSGSLFEKNLLYAIFLIISFFLLIRNFYDQLKIVVHLKEVFTSLILVFPFVILLFIFFPRSMSPIDVGNVNPENGEIGYSPNVIISKYSSLTVSNLSAFQVEILTPHARGPYYWRGNSVSQNNGWDWTVSDADYENKISSVDLPDASSDFLKQRVKLQFKSQFLLGIDSPKYFRFKDKIYEPMNSGNVTSFNSLLGSKRYEVWSREQNSSVEIKNIKPYLRSGLTMAERQWIRENFKSTHIEDLLLEVKHFYAKNNFSYNLNPGVTESFLSFMKNKQGVCSHFSSALALILREKKIPSRLVSGFLGGEFNPYGNFFMVSQKDAHVWVEYLDQGTWKKIDPTLWIIPNRSLISTDEFLENLNSGFNLFKKNNLPFLSFFSELKLWFSQWDFKFYQWIETIDYTEQTKLFDLLGLKRTWIYALICLVVFLFLSSMYWVRRPKLSEVDKLWSLFFKIIRSRFRVEENYDLNELKSKFSSNKKVILSLKEIEYLAGSGSGNYKKIKKMIKDIN